MHWYGYLALGGIAIIAGLIDTIAGGGGLICIPALLSAGLSPTMSLGTNKLQSLVGELNSALYFIRKKQVSLRHLSLAMIFTAISAAVGAVCVQLIHDDILKKMLPILLLIVLLYTLFSPKAKNIEGSAKLSWNHFSVLFGIVIGFYNGFIGPPTGSLWMFALMFFAGFNIVKATMHTKPLNCLGNISSVLPFIFTGQVNYIVAAVMALGQLLGSHIGAGLVVRRGHQLIRPLYISVVSIMLLDVFIKAY